MQLFAVGGVSKKGKKVKPDEAKCTDCHTGTLAEKTIHAPAGASCESCHSVNIKEHTEKGIGGLHLTDTLPGLCFGCHDAVKTEQTAPFQHKALNRTKSCVQCHSPHSAPESKLLPREEKMLCLSCHKRDVSAKGVKKVSVGTRVLANKAVVHAPVEGGCVSCHKPHGSQIASLLSNSFPALQYSNGVKDTFSLCWSCHDAEMISTEKTTTATSFRDGDRNLHYLHVKGDRGRSCVLCHNPHGTKNPHLIETTVNYGKWSLPIRYKASENGGSCFPGCHAPKEYKRPSNS